MAAVVALATLPPAEERLVKLMQEVNHGRIKGLVVRNGNLIFEPRPRVLRDFKPGGENGPRPETRLQDFLLKREVVDLLDFLSCLADAIVDIEVKGGLPLKATIEEKCA